MGKCTSALINVCIDAKVFMTYQPRETFVTILMNVLQCYVSGVFQRDDRPKKSQTSSEAASTT